MNVATSFLNSKGRRIYQGAKGGYFAKKADGTRVYGIKAAKRVAVGSNSAPRKIVNSVRNEVPSAIRPAVRKTRTNKGVARGPQVGVGRKVRSNKGVARGPQVGVVQRRTDAEARRLAARRAAGRKTRSNKGVARGPQVGVVQRRIDAEARRRAAAKARMARRRQAMANVKAMANKNPYSALARGEPVVGRKVRSNKGVARGPRKAPVPKKEVAARVSAINELINAIKTANKMLNNAPKPRRSARLATMAATTNSKVRVSPKMKQMVRRRASAKK